jgi:diguanylate cyclase (GGDEF)-like protein
MSTTKPATAPQAPAHADTADRPIDLLVVEDEADDYQLQTRALHQDGIETAARRAASVAEAKRALKAHVPDLLLLDFTLPDGDAFDVLDEVRRTCPQLPVILVAGSVGEEVAVETLKRGAVDYVLKASLQRLPNAVRSALERAGDLAEIERARTETARSEAALRHAQQISRLGHYVWSSRTHSIVSCSEAFLRVVGHDADSLPRDFSDTLRWVHADDRDRVAAAHIEAGRTRSRLEIGYRLLRPDGSIIDVAEIVEPGDEGGDWFITVQDVSALKRTEREVRLLLDMMQAVDAAPDFDAALGAALETVASIAGFEYGEAWVPDTGDAVLLPSARWYGNAERFGAFRQISERMRMARGEGLIGRVWQRGESEWVENLTQADTSRFLRAESLLALGLKAVLGVPIVDSQRRTVAVLNFCGLKGAAIDSALTRVVEGAARQLGAVFERKAAQQRAERLGQMYRVLSEINAAIVRADDRQSLFEQACRSVVHRSNVRFAWIGRVDAAGPRFVPVASEGPDRDFLQIIADWLERGQVEGWGILGRALVASEPVIVNDLQAEPELKYRDELLGRGFRAVCALPLREAQRIDYVLVLYANEAGFFDDEEMRLLRELAGDISFALDHLSQVEQADYVAHNDPLTGLPNRRRLSERLAQDIAGARRQQVGLSVAVANIDRFQQINDRFGRDAGDDLMRQIARRIESAVAEPGFAARLGGDNFALTVYGAGQVEQILPALEGFMRQVFEAPFRAGAHEVILTARTGIAMFPVDGDDPETLLTRAEAAMAGARASGERHSFYARELGERAAARFALEAGLRRALEQDEFVLHYQPKVDSATRRTLGLEALIRWAPPGEALVPPGQFIPVLEESGMIVEVGRWALNRAVADARRWIEGGLAVPRIAVNVSALQLRRQDFVDMVREALAGGGDAPVKLELEITESVIMADFNTHVRTLAALRELGVSIAIDDFGTGYSSLDYLSRLPVDSLKIDRAFVTRMVESPDGMAIVSTIITLAHSLRLRVVAEGVETDEQARYLHLLRCDEMQGFLFSKPLAPERARHWLAGTTPAAS